MLSLSVFIIHYIDVRYIIVVVAHHFIYIRNGRIYRACKGILLCTTLMEEKTKKNMKHIIYGPVSVSLFDTIATIA